MPVISAGRNAALRVLELVAGGAYASDSLLEHTAHLAGRDAGLAGQIVFGVLRFQAQLDYLIRHYSGREVAKLDLPVVLALRTAMFQLRYLDRIPAHAAVHETVEYVKKHRRAASGFVNAVLRKVNRNRVTWPDEATRVSCPAWLIERWRAHFGASAAIGIAEAALQQPALYVRNPPPGVDAEATDVPGGFRLKGDLPAGMRAQDIGSQSLVPLLGIQSGMSFLDVCAAPGNKTMQALELQPALALACDISWKRLKTVPPLCARVVLDAAEPLPFARGFDRILVDAPCSGTGTLGRNPEIKWRVQAEDFPRFQEKQTRILLSAFEALNPGGRMVYATCSLEREENEDVVEHALRRAQALRKVGEQWRIPGREEGDGFYAAVLEKMA